MQRPLTPYLAPKSVSALWRCLLRVIAAGYVAILWPGNSVALSMADICIGMAAWCLIGASYLREPMFGPDLNRWDEAVTLLAIARFLPKFF